jgi:hypothetical protein
MAVAKIQVSIGSIAFSGEGDEVWLEKQLDKLLKAAPELIATTTPEPDKGKKSENGSAGSLAAFLAKKTATDNQIKRFLATAEWLHLKGTKRLQTKDVSKALSDNNQKKLSNPADCLNKNVAKGHCEKDGDNFFVTPEGRSALG